MGVLTDFLIPPAGLDDEPLDPGPLDPPLDPGPTDAELFERARTHDLEAVALLWRRHFSYTQHLASRFTRTATDAEDLAAEAFVKILALLRDGRGPLDHARTYIARTVRNLATDRSRKLSLLEVPIETAHEVASHDDPANEATHIIELGITLRGLAACSERQRFAIWRTACEGDGLAVVADELGISRNAVAALLSRGRESIRRTIAQQEAPSARRPRAASAAARVPVG